LINRLERLNTLLPLLVLDVVGHPFIGLATNGDQSPLPLALPLRRARW
jgi:hypothetical protein